ncbi:MAG: NlpC/P60 family protein [Vicinamibacterales bacterium]
MKRRLLAASSLVLALLVQPSTLAQKGQTKYVNRPVLNMFSSATTDTDVVSQAIFATPVTVLEEKDGWANIRTPDDYTGWVEAAALIRPDFAEPYLSGANKVIQVRSLFAHIYREASVTRHAPMLTVPFETKLEVDSQSGAQKSERWLQVRLPDGRAGFIQAGDVGPVASNLSVDETIALSKKFLGLPYTWGGTSSYGFDCSGFVQMLMRQRGYMMPRDAGPQSRWERLVPVDRSELAPGDLLFFGSAPEKVTHTGMYIGDGFFINATTHETPAVRIDNLNEPYWAKILVGARRPRK